MKITKASLSDLHLIAPLFDQYRQFYKLPSNITGATAFLAERLGKEESVIYLAFNDNNEAVGFVQLYPSFSSLSMKPQWILNDLFVLPAFRKMKVARDLVNMGEKLAKETGSKGLTLMTAKDNAPAQKLYLSLGWKEVVEFTTFSKNL